MNKRNILQLSNYKHSSNNKNFIPRFISFTRRELSLILSVYGRKVASGEWKDYAIDCLQDKAIFSVFKNSHEVPTYMIIKDPNLSKLQGAYIVRSSSGHILKRGHDLENALQILEKAKRFRALG
ncbi:MAG: DUF2794 domain-containing protein [Alphaproteobacteria bacterium]